ncbi:MAG: SDR family oxidoreductase [Phycisphaeraceae bacterium]
MKTAYSLPIGLGLASAALFAAWGIRRRRRMSFDRAAVIITGGSRGLGLELARCFAAEGARVTLLGRDERSLAAASAELSKTFGVPVFAQRCDVRDRDDVGRAIKNAKHRFGRIDVLVNNAGVIDFGPFEHMQVDDYRDNIDTHLFGPLYAALEVIPHMKHQGGGRIVNIASIGGLVTFPHAAPYCASKHAAVGLSDGMRAELARHNIRVTTVCPGLMRTGSHVNARFKGRHHAEYTWFALGAAAPWMSTSSKRAARRIVEACRYGRTSLVLTLPARLLKTADAIAPGLVARWMQFGNRLLPAPAEVDGDLRHTGWESGTRLTRTFLTRSADRAVSVNNQVQRDAHARA